jgi:hypothetical protein
MLWWGPLFDPRDVDPLVQHLDVPGGSASSLTATDCPAPTGNGSWRWPCCVFTPPIPGGTLRPLREPRPDDEDED